MPWKGEISGTVTKTLKVLFPKPKWLEGLWNRSTKERGPSVLGSKNSGIPGDAQSFVHSLQFEFCT